MVVGKVTRNLRVLKCTYVVLVQSGDRTRSHDLSNARSSSLSQGNVFSTISCRFTCRTDPPSAFGIVSGNTEADDEVVSSYRNL